ncbi:MAG: hypothetical protein ABFQ95_04335 [Pseudomonadota bacterium]
MLSNHKQNDRIQSYAHAATELACLSNSQLANLLNTATPTHVGIGGQSVMLTIDGTKIFVKKIALLAQ